jgi:hypothetical protein
VVETIEEGKSPEIRDEPEVQNSAHSRKVGGWPMSRFSDMGHQAHVSEAGDGHTERFSLSTPLNRKFHRKLLIANEIIFQKFGR